MHPFIYLFNSKVAAVAKSQSYLIPFNKEANKEDDEWIQRYE